ncbi:hypothetical protein Tco_1372119, partial [Tanacetum coccineum]
LKIMRIILAHEAKQNDFRHGLLFGHLQSVGLDFPIYLSKLIMWDIEGRSTDITPYKLKKLVASDKFVKVKASFKLSSTAKPKQKGPAKASQLAKTKTAPANLLRKTKPVAKD